MNANGGPGRTAFVFAGGGSLGAIEVGMLRALVEHGVHPDFVVGSSVGAINAAYFAGAPDLAGIRGLEGVWRAVRNEHVFPLSTLGSLAAILSGRSHLANPGPLQDLLERSFSDRRLEGSVIPCVIVATELLGGEEVRLSSGPIVEALLASTAVPAVFPPVALGGRQLVDGMVSSHTPIVAAVAAGAARVVVLPTGYACALPRPPKGALNLALHSLNLMVARQIASDVEHYAGRARLVVVPPLCPVAVGTNDFSRTDELMKRAKESTRDWLAAGGLESRVVPESLMPHDHGTSVERC
jgi:NTE family protein